MDLPEFVRLFEKRAPHLMWFLGAGASAAGGIPTAGDMIWEFKRQIYCSEQGVSIKACGNLSDPKIRVTLQNYFDRVGGFPLQGDVDEYAVYFEVAYPSEVDRQKYVESWISRGHPSFGHKSLATLMLMGRSQIVWTTNFDDLVEMSLDQVKGESTRYTCASLDAANLALDALNDQRYPLIVKLHGDYRSRRLKNSQRELENQDELLKHTFIEACKRFGLIIVGYSGRDDSIMSALEDAVKQRHSFPQGLYWLVQEGTLCLPRVQQLVQDARQSGIESAIVEIGSFDEFLDRILVLEKDVPAHLWENLLPYRSRASAVPFPKAKEEAWPVVRLNALPLQFSPVQCYLIESNIGGTGDVREALEKAGSEAVAVRCRHGVLAFGNEQELRAVFSSYNLGRIIPYSLDGVLMTERTSEKGLMAEALTKAVARERHLSIHRRRGSHLLTIPSDASTNGLTRMLRTAVGSTTGMLSGTGRQWAEAISLRIERARDSAWLLLKPTVWIEDEDGLPEEHKEIAKEFVRERLATRYNFSWNCILNGWINILTAGKAQSELHLFGGGGIGDATFVICRNTAFSHRGRGLS